MRARARATCASSFACCYCLLFVNAQHVFLEGDVDQILFSELGLLLDATRTSGREEATIENSE